MRTGLARLFESLRTNFWFVPSLMLLGALFLAWGLLRVDAHLDPGMEAKLQWAYSGGPSGARSLLSTVAGSMITAASVTFSLASVALSLASQQYGSRVLRNFMRDTVTQVMLGIFVATFLYSVVVVRAIRGTDRGGGFVPAVSITAGIVLTLLSLLALVYFVHHVSESIQASRIVETIVSDLGDSIERLYPSGAPDEALREEERVAMGRKRSVELVLPSSGYVQSVDLDRLVKVGAEADLMLQVKVKPGDYVLPGATVMEVLGAGVEETAPRCDKKTLRKLRRCFTLGGERTPTQDVRYQFQQLTDVVVRALSPGINDPFTAITGIDQMAGSLLQMARRPAVASCRRDAQGRARVVAPAADLSEVLEATVAHIGIYAAADRFVMGHLRRVLDVLEPQLKDGRERAKVALVRAELVRREAAEE